MKVCSLCRSQMVGVRGLLVCPHCDALPREEYVPRVDHSWRLDG